MRMPPVTYCGECIMLMTSFRDFVEACVDMKQQGVGGCDSWGARPNLPTKSRLIVITVRGFTLVPVRSADQANEALIRIIDNLSINFFFKEKTHERFI